MNFYYFNINAENMPLPCLVAKLSLPRPLTLFNRLGFYQERMLNNTTPKKTPSSLHLCSNTESCENVSFVFLDLILLHINFRKYGTVPYKSCNSDLTMTSNNAWQLLLSMLVTEWWKQFVETYNLVTLHSHIMR